MCLICPESSAAAILGMSDLGGAEGFRGWRCRMGEVTLAGLAISVAVPVEVVHDLELFLPEGQLAGFPAEGQMSWPVIGLFMVGFIAGGSSWGVQRRGN